VNETRNVSHFSISVNNLSKRFNREWIFRNLSYEFHSGKTYAITGPNGSGKSTLLQVLWGQVPQTSGTLEYNLEGNSLPVEDVYKHLAIATPYMDLIEEFTLQEMLKFHFSLKAVRSDLRFDELARRMYLEDAMDKHLVNFSSGMRQRLRLALALYSRASVYFLDEPGTNLDAVAFDWYRKELGALPPSALVIIASNDPDEYPAESTRLSMSDHKT
jgi:ABC-type multidrug transport system ATPase subunit